MSTWVLLGAAIACEVAATVSLRASEGFARLWPSVIVVIGYGASFYLLSLILKTGIPSGIVYAIWSAFGIALVTLIGMAAFGDKISPVNGLGLVVVIVGVVLVQAGHVSDTVH
jgi:small multidrug resistance pump